MTVEQFRRSEPHWLKLCITDGKNNKPLNILANEKATPGRKPSLVISTARAALPSERLQRKHCSSKRSASAPPTSAVSPPS